MTGIIKMRIPAKANTIMTPRMISHKKRSMSILGGHSELSKRLKETLRQMCWCRRLRSRQDVVGCTKTQKHTALSTKRAAVDLSLETRHARQH